MAALRFRYAPPAAGHGGGDNYALTIKPDHSVGAGHEPLNEELFDSLTDARRKLVVWRYDYNNVRPHSSLGNRTPAQARRAFLQDGSVTSGTLVPASEHEYQADRLSL